MSFAKLLDHTVTVKRKSLGTDGYGSTLTFADVATGLPAAVQRKDARLADDGAGARDDGTHRVFLKASADVVAEDLIEATAGPESPVTLRVLSVTKPRGHHIEASCEVWDGVVDEASS